LLDKAVRDPGRVLHDADADAQQPAQPVYLGGTLRAAKNTLAVLALREAGLGVPEELFTGSTVLSFAHGDISAVAKAVTEFAKAHGDKFTIKGAVMGKQVLGVEEVKALASLPPLNVLRGRLIGVLQAPAARLIGVLSAPGRQIATVLKAYADKAEAPADTAEMPAEAAA
jgi:large subunit ribosomal protein L10